MNPAQGKETQNEIPAGKKRPFLLTLLCLFSVIFFGLIAILFLFSDLYSGRITEVMNYYITGASLTVGRVAWISTGAFILHAACVAGCILMWRMKKAGYYIFSISALIISLFQLFHRNIPVGTTAVYIILILLFGIFFRKMGPFRFKKGA